VVWVAGCRGEGDLDGVTSGDGGAREVQGLCRETERREMDGGVVAGTPLPPRGEVQVGAKQRELVGVREQRVHRGRDEVDRRLVARDQEEEGHAEELLGAQAGPRRGEVAE
jgi:hypothetical protein